MLVQAAASAGRCSETFEIAEGLKRNEKIICYTGISLRYPCGGSAADNYCPV